MDYLHTNKRVQQTQSIFSGLLNTLLTIIFSLFAKLG